jgi:hypothetical protein
MRTVVALSTVFLALSPAALGQEAAPEAEPDTGLWNQILRLYEQAKESGERVPKDVYEWLTQEVQGIGDWEYRVVEMKEAGPAETEARLNELGAERWECIWIETVGRKTRFILKRPVKGYLGQIPLSELIKLIPYPGSGDAGP